MPDRTLERLFRFHELDRMVLRENLRNDDGYTKSPNGFDCTLVFPHSIFITGRGPDTFTAISTAVDEAFDHLPNFNSLRNRHIYAVTKPKEQPRHEHL